MIWWILLGIWVLVFIASLCLAKLAKEPSMAQPVIFGLIPIVGSLFAIYIYCIAISQKSEEKSIEK